MSSASLNISGRKKGYLNLTGRNRSGHLNFSGRRILSKTDVLTLTPAVVSVVGQVLTIVEAGGATDFVGFNFENDVISDVGKAITMSNPGALGFDTGISGQAIDFNGTNKLESSDDLFINVGDESFEILTWIKLQATGQNHGIAGQTNSQYHIHVLSGGTVRWRVNGTICSSGAGAIDDTTTWHHINCYYDHTTDISTLIIDNGTPITLGSVTGPTPSTAVFSIGSIGSGNLANALVDSFKFKRGLFSAGERSAHWNGGSGGPV